MDIGQVKVYLRIDEDADDSILSLMMQAAEQYIIDAVGEYNEANPKAQLLYMAIVQDLYENRALEVTESQRRSLSYTFRSIITQLQCEQYAKEDNADAG